MFAFQTLGVMADAAEAIATDADVSCLYFRIQILHCLHPKSLFRQGSLPYRILGILLCSFTGGGPADSNGQCCRS